MSRRLGDDPLARAKAARSSAEAGAESAPQPTVRSRASYNDVFFLVKAEGSQVATVSALGPDAPEITEISQIPEIREAAAAPVAVASLAQSGPESAPPVSFVEEVVTKFSAPAPTQEVKAETESAPAPQAPESSVDQPQKSGGFLKRLFGKFK